MTAPPPRIDGRLPLGYREHPCDGGHLGFGAMWSFRADGNRSAEVVVLPDSRSDLVLGFTTGASGVPEALTLRCAGPARSARTASVSAGEGRLGLRFHAGWIPSVFGVPAAEIAEASVEVGELLGVRDVPVDLLRPTGTERELAGRLPGLVRSRPAPLPPAPVRRSTELLR